MICAPVVAREARAAGQGRCEAHYAHLVVHGVLHLQGYDHERAREAARMERRETAILARLGFADPYAQCRDCVERRDRLAPMDRPVADHKPSFLERLGALLMREPEDREQLIELLHSRLRAQPARRRRALDDRGRAAGVRDAGRATS